MFHNKDYIYCVYQESSFSKAAEKLHISQPALSATVGKVEKQLGMKIFDRKTNPISLTPFGVEYIRGIERINEVEEHLQTLSYELHTLQSGTLSIGGSNLSISYIVPRVIAQFKKQYPQIQLNIADMNTTQAKHMLDSGSLDLVITNRPLDTSKYVRRVCYEECLVLTVPRAFPVNAVLEPCRLRCEELGDRIFDVPEERCVSLSAVSDLPFILLSDANYLRLCTDILFQESQVEPHIVLETECSSVSYNFANLGIGATIFSSRLADGVSGNDNLCYYKIRSKFTRRETFVCYSKSRYLTAAMKKFMELLSQAAGA